MRGSVWATLLRCIPPEHHNILMLVTRCGPEIALQNILRLDDEILAIRGRLAGSQDSGRLYFVPLDNIDYFGFNRMVKDEEYVALFGNYQPPLEAAPAPPAGAGIAGGFPAPAIARWQRRSSAENSNSRADPRRPPSGSTRRQTPTR